MQPWDPWGLGSRPCLLILVPAIPWYFSFSKREGDFHKQIPSQWALFWPSSSVGPLLVFGCLFQSVFLDLHLHRYLLSPPSHSGIYHLEVWEEIFHIHVLPALRHIHSSVSIWSLTTEEHRPLPRWLQGPMPGSWVSLQLLQQPRVYTHKNNLSGQVCLLLQLKKLNLQLCCKRVWKNLSRPFCSPPPEIPPHVNSWLSDSRLAFRLEWDSLLLTLSLLLLCLWEQSGGNSVIMKFWVAVTHTTGSVGGHAWTGDGWGKKNTEMILSKQHTHQAEDRRRRKSIFNAASLLTVLLLQWEYRSQVCSKDVLRNFLPLRKWWMHAYNRMCRMCNWIQSLINAETHSAHRYILIAPTPSSAPHL